MYRCLSFRCFPEEEARIYTFLVDQNIADAEFEICPIAHYPLLLSCFNLPL